MSTSDSAPDSDARTPAELEELAAYLEEEFEALTMAAQRLRERGAAPSHMEQADLLRVLAQLRLAGGVDSLTGAFLDMKYAEEEAAERLLDAVGDEDTGDFDDFDDDALDDDFDD
jgi:hypothetical protein